MVLDEIRKESKSSGKEIPIKVLLCTFLHLPPPLFVGVCLFGGNRNLFYSKVRTWCDGQDTMWWSGHDVMHMLWHIVKQPLVVPMYYCSFFCCCCCCAHLMHTCITHQYYHTLTSYELFIIEQEAGKILVLANDERTCYQLREVSKMYVACMYMHMCCTIDWLIMHVPKVLKFIIRKLCPLPILLMFVMPVPTYM